MCGNIKTRTKKKRNGHEEGGKTGKPFIISFNKRQTKIGRKVQVQQNDVMWKRTNERGCRHTGQKLLKIFI